MRKYNQKNGRNFTRRNFLITSTTGLVGMTVSPTMSFAEKSDISTENTIKNRVVTPFVSEVERLAVEEPYDYHKHFSTALVPPYSLKEKLLVLKDTLLYQLPKVRKENI